MSRKRGDVNNDGKIGTLDAVHMLGHIANIPTFQLSPESSRAADVSNSGSSTSTSDVNYFLNNLVGNEGFPITGSLFTYEFYRNGDNTVSHSGQTARLGMADEIHSALSDSSLSKSDIENMYLNTNATFPSGNSYDSSKKYGPNLDMILMNQRVSKVKM